MTAHRHYARAPITEALIDIQVDLPAEIELKDLEAIQAAIKTEYPGRRTRLTLRGEFSAGEQAGATARQKTMGYLFYSPDERQVFQARLDGFTYSRLAPYQNWESLRDEAIRLWQRYRTVTQPTKVKRVAVRYINQINIPQLSVDFKDYFRTFPEISPDLPQGLSEYLMRLAVPQEDLKATLILTQAMVPPPQPDTVSVLLDIDLFIDNVAFASETELWALLEAFRARKNEFFEGCITDETRRLIN